MWKVVMQGAAKYNQVAIVRWMYQAFPKMYVYAKMHVQFALDLAVQEGHVEVVQEMYTYDLKRTKEAKGEEAKTKLKLYSPGTLKKVGQCKTHDVVLCLQWLHSVQPFEKKTASTFCMAQHPFQKM